MPFGSAPLPEAQIALIQKWIDQLPEEEPAVALRKAESAVALAEKQLASARAYLPAVEARIAADRAKLSDPPDPQAETLAKTALQAERQYQLVKAEEGLCKAQQKLTEVSRCPRLPTKRPRRNATERSLPRARMSKLPRRHWPNPARSSRPLPSGIPKTSTGRRLALARWMVNRENPLTARVAINHIWMRHFGKPIVPTVVNFGLNGKPPSHPELLDWLAVRVDGKKLEHEGHSPPDRDQQYVSDEVFLT